MRPSRRTAARVYRALRQRLPDEAFLEIEPLTAAQGRDILLALEAGASPLYLRVAFEIARGWRSWDEASQGRCVLADDTAALIGQLIAS